MPLPWPCGGWSVFAHPWLWVWPVVNGILADATQAKTWNVLAWLVLPSSAITMRRTRPMEMLIPEQVAPGPDLQPGEKSNGIQAKLTESQLVCWWAWDDSYFSVLLGFCGWLLCSENWWINTHRILLLSNPEEIYILNETPITTSPVQDI